MDPFEFEGKNYDLGDELKNYFRECEFDPSKVVVAADATEDETGRKCTLCWRYDQKISWKEVDPADIPSLDKDFDWDVVSYVVYWD